MLTYTLAEFLETDVDEGDATIYVVRDGEIVLYVGKATAGIQERWIYSQSPHVIVNGLEWQGWSSIGSVIVKHYPGSREWQIDLYTAKECWPLVTKHFGPWAHYEDGDCRVETAEVAMIQELRPLFNVASTGYDREIPAKYASGPAMATLAMDRLMR